MVLSRKGGVLSLYLCKMAPNLEDDTLFPINFPDVGGKTFLWVWENRKEFVEFTLGMIETTKLFKVWQQYCENKR